MTRTTRLATAVLAAWLTMPTSLLRAQEPATRPLLSVQDQVAALKAPTLPPNERDEAARRLVTDRTPAAKQAVHDALVDFRSRRGQEAVARALGASVDPDPAFVNELFQLATTDPPTNEIAIQALANYRTPDVRDRLIELARDPNHQQHDTTRLAAISAVGTYADKNAARALLDILTSDAEAGTAFHKAAAAALAQLSGVRGNGDDAARWQQWWNANASKSDTDFENDMLQARAARFNRFQHRYDRMVEESNSLLTEAYQSTPNDKNREVLLLRYLRSEIPETRLVGLQIVHAEFTQSRPISPAVRTQLRSMIGDSSTDVRVQVAKTLEELNDATALDALINQLHQEPDPDVRASLVEALVTIQDVGKVVPELLKALNDDSPQVAEAAANGLAKLGPLIHDKDGDMVRQVSETVQKTLADKAQGPGKATFRAALIDALAPLKIQDLNLLFTHMLEAGEPVSVRVAAAKALGELGQNWAADTLINSLDDPEMRVREAVLDALKLCATFPNAERIYSVLRDPKEPQSVRDKAWQVLETLFPKAAPQQLAFWADRFKDEHDRRYIILKQESDQLRQADRAADLASVQEQIADELMAMDRPDEAAQYYTAALEFYKAAGNQQQLVDAISERLMDALLESGQYAKACDFAAKSIQANQGNQLAMGTRLRNKVDRLRQKGDYEGALTLIAAIKKMQPQLAQQFMSYIQQWEDEIRKVYPQKAKSLAPEPTNALGAAPTQP